MTHDERAREWAAARGIVPTDHIVATLRAEFAAVEAEATGNVLAVMSIGLAEAKDPIAACIKLQKRVAVLEAALNVERIATLEHEQWRQWAKSLMASESISAERRDRWNALMVPYAELSEEMKDFDREWAHRVIGDALSGEPTALLKMLERAVEAGRVLTDRDGILSNRDIAKRVWEGR